MTPAALRGCVGDGHDGRQQHKSKAFWSSTRKKNEDGKGTSSGIERGLRSHRCCRGESPGISDWISCRGCENNYLLVLG